MVGELQFAHPLAWTPDRHRRGPSPNPARAPATPAGVILVCASAAPGLPPVGLLWGSEIPAGAEILEGEVWRALKSQKSKQIND